MAAQEELGGDLRRAQTWFPYGACKVFPWFIKVPSC